MMKVYPDSMTSFHESLTPIYKALSAIFFFHHHYTYKPYIYATELLTVESI